jgi:eukaryotic-like serine/threonine-protein kinase
VDVAAVSAVPDDAPLLTRGSVIDQQWVILSVLGSGGSGAVYRCRHLHDTTHPEVAVKLLTNSGEVARFSRERLVMEGARHPHVVTLLDIGKHGHQPYLVLELAAGGSINDLLERQGALEPRLAVWIIIQAVSGLRARHLVHRDLKPHNLLIGLSDGQRRADFIIGDATTGSRVMIADFGLAKPIVGGGKSITITNQVMGTPLYMSPEQCRNTKVVGVESDIYSLGIILYELVTGHPPFDGEDPYAILVQQVNNEPVIPESLDPGLREILQRCLRKDPADRFRTLRSLEEALRKWCQLPTTVTSEAIAPVDTGFLARVRRLFGR